MTNKYQDRKYEVLPYDKNWVRLFGNEAKKIKEIFGDCVVGIEHVGSTSVMGMSGKPTIDILVLANNISCGDASISGMKKLGYVSKGEYVAADSRLFTKEKDGHILFNIHIFQPEHDEAKKMLLLRDFLRKNKNEADNYGSLKLQLFEKYPEDYGMYRKEKDEYVEKPMARAMEEGKNINKAKTAINLFMKKFISNSPEESKKIAQDFAEEILAKKGEEGGALVLALVGDLGSGKTTFARNFAESLGVKEKIKSPTFIIFRKSKILNKKWQEKCFENFYHFDVYRIHSEKEILNLGWQEIISNPENIVLAEWADKIEKILPKNRIKINFKHLKGDKREILFHNFCKLI